MPEIDTITSGDAIPVAQGAHIFYVEDSDPYQLGVDWNRAYRAARSKVLRIMRDVASLRDELPELRQLQERAQQLADHPDAGTVLNHLADLNLAVELPDDAAAAAEVIVRDLRVPFEINHSVRLQDLPPPRAALDIEPGRMQEWDALLDRIIGNEVLIAEINEENKQHRRDIRDIQRLISRGNLAIADARYDNRQAMIELRALQPQAIALAENANAPAEIRRAASVNLRVNMYSAREWDDFVGLIPTLRIGGTVYSDTS